MNELTPEMIKETIQETKELSQIGLAEYCQVSKSTVSKWLNGHQEIPDSRMQEIQEYIEKYTPKETNKETLTKEKQKVSKYDAIRNDLMEQLQQQNKTGKHYVDLVNHAVYLFKLKDDLQKDIEVNGIRISQMTGNGYERITDNASIRNLNNVSAQLMRVLKGLGLDEPEVDEELNFDDFV